MGWNVEFEVDPELEKKCQNFMINVPFTPNKQVDIKFLEKYFQFIHSEENSMSYVFNCPSEELPFAYHGYPCFKYTKQEFYKLSNSIFEKGLTQGYLTSVPENSLGWAWARLENNESVYGLLVIKNLDEMNLERIRRRTLNSPNKPSGIRVRDPIQAEDMDFYYCFFSPSTEENARLAQDQVLEAIVKREKHL